MTFYIVHCFYIGSLSLNLTFFTILITSLFLFQKDLKSWNKTNHCQALQKYISNCKLTCILLNGVTLDDCFPYNYSFYHQHFYSYCHSKGNPSMLRTSFSDSNVNNSVFSLWLKVIPNLFPFFQNHLLSRRWSNCWGCYYSDFV